MMTTLLTGSDTRPRLTLPAPHPGQVEVFGRARRFNWLCAGRRWRKTSGTAAFAVERAARGQQIVWGAPVYKQVRTAWREFRRMAASVADFNQSEMVITFPQTGGTITCVTLHDPDNARSLTADGVVLDEAALLPPEVWYDVLQPTLMDTNGWLFAMFTPKGRNWVWEEFGRALGRHDSRAWNVPSLGARITEDGHLVRLPHPLENPHLPWEEIRRLYQAMGERAFRQEILAEFLADAGGVFRRVRETATATRQDAPTPGHQYVVGVDWGKEDDYTVLTVLDATTRTVATVDRSNRIDYTFQVGRLEALCALWRPTLLVVEANAMGTPLIETLERRALPIQPFVTTNASKKLVVEGLALALERGDLTLLDGKTTVGETVIDELEAFESRRLPGGLYRYGAPAGKHDDTVISLALAWSAVAEFAGGADAIQVWSSGGQGVTGW